jgi:glycosyltransferase involved in cell wall biosynthesis
MSARLNRKVLVLSPSASHPQDYGNRNRIFQTTSKFKEWGYDVHFVLYPYESDWVREVPESAAEMRKAWTSFTVVPPSKPAHMPAADGHHLIDEWWDPEIGRYLEWLFAREYFDVFVVNYTFFSKAFEYAPDTTIKVLETHDLFTGRKELFEAFGAEPEFFYTTEAEERIAFDRADIVLAIKDAEADVVRKMTSKVVVSLPCDVRERSLRPRPDRMEPDGELRVGFIGALNTVNSLNMQRFLERFAKIEKIYVPPALKVSVAGNVCTKLNASDSTVRLLGRVESVEDFYRDIDVVIAPMDFSTGIKIKVGEALSYGKAVVATQNGFDGFPPMDPFHKLENIDHLCRALIQLAFDRERLQLLEARSQVSARLAKYRSEAGYATLARRIQGLTKKIIFITDLEVWKSETVQQERLAQWCEMCSFVARVAILYVGSGGGERITSAHKRLAKFSDVYDHATQPEAALETLSTLEKSFDVVELVISAGDGAGSFFWDRLKDRFNRITLDTWVPELAEIAAAASHASSKDIWLANKSSQEGPGGGQLFATTALRYMPDTLSAPALPSAPSDILVVLCEPDWSDRVGVDRLLSTPEIENSISVVESPDYANYVRDNDIFKQLRGRSIPGMVVAVGHNARAVEIVRCMATSWQVRFLHISSAHFPCALGRAGGSPSLCTSYGDFAVYLSNLAEAEPNASVDARDAGWNLYWRSFRSTQA